MSSLHQPVGRRQFVSGALGLGAAMGSRSWLARSLAVVAGTTATLTSGDSLAAWNAAPPAGFVPFRVPGKVVKITRGNDYASLMQKNELWPKAEVAKMMLERALMEFTGAPNMVDAVGRFIHKDDKVAIKVNGIAGQHGYTVAVNFELILPLVEALITLGVPAPNIHLFEQFPDFLKGTRIGVDGYDLPAGVVTSFHGNFRTKMPEVAIYQNIKTRFVTAVTDATAIIDMTMMKDHSICGFTGALKNMTHGQIVNPHKHHAHLCSPQIPVLYNHPVLQSRVRLHITDAFKIIYDGGPLDKLPDRRLPHGAVYVATDPVALDRIGIDVIEAARKSNGLPSLAKVGREPSYVNIASDMGIGIADLNRIRLQHVAL
ncbi:MAG: DUF362 domain-containing protein [Polyangiaceae bacterium]|nr:DUF362 domain-containing protein [Polyangiaceae bacterium]